jgi:hypothetical protein
MRNVKRTPAFLFLLSILLAGCTNGFEGVIKFKTEVSVTDPAATGFLEQLKNKYGNSLNVYYSASGHFLREYLNTGEFGNNHQLYLKGSGKLLINNKGSNEVETLDVSKNTLKLIEMTESNDTIMGLACNCYNFKAFDDHDQRVLTFCYSEKTPRIKPKDFKDHKDYFVDEFFKLSKRPYLKFSINARDFNLTFTAVELKEMKLDDKVFIK